MEDYIEYNKLIDKAMRDVVKKTLQIIKKDGLMGEHHFLISFLTCAEGVEISLVLKEKYPEEMTIVVQHQYEDLEINEENFSIVLHFDGVKERITIPFEALTSFTDPGVKFGLKFNILSSPNDDEIEELFRREVEKELLLEKKPSKVKKIKKEGAEKDTKKTKSKKSSKKGNIVDLENFRKK